MLENKVRNLSLNKFLLSQKEIEIFTRDIKLFDYQIDAIMNTLKFLEFAFWQGDFDKEKVYNEFYKNENINIEFENEWFNEYESYSYLLLEKEKKIEFKDLVNRCNYWMATGSGKTFIMIKLISILKILMKKNLIPKKNILILAPTDKIIKQIIFHIENFNSFNKETINLKDLREFEKDDSVYIYRANNIVISESKTEQLNFKEFWDNGNWYVILDEAHKGDSGDSIRKKIFNLIAKNGILFNFSATFTDEIDKVTCIKDFKLDKFIKTGYGKKIMLLDKSVATKDENQKDNITQSLILLGFLRKKYKEIKFYSSPLMLTLANTINTDDADLKEFFRKLAQIAKGDFDFERNKKELENTINDMEYLFNLGNLKVDIDLSIKEFYKYVFNSKMPSEIEVIKIEKNDKELLFKLKESNEHFMLITADKIVKWNDDFLDGYIIGKSVAKSFFNEINELENISILMGSRIFIEGWDSNRPSIINFVNLGKRDAEKLVLQAIGRGVRIEPFKNFRRRMCENIQNMTIPKNFTCNEMLETLFIFPSKTEYIKQIVENLKKVSDEKECRKIQVKKNNIEKKLCIPKFEESDELNNKSFVIHNEDLKEFLEKFYKYSENLLIVKYEITARTINFIKKNNFKNGRKRKEKDFSLLLKTMDSFWNKRYKKFIGFKVIEDEIRHFEKICAFLDEKTIKEIQKDIDSIIEQKHCLNSNKKEMEEKLMKNFTSMSFEEFKTLQDSLKNNEFLSENFSNFLECEILFENYYLPILYKKDSEYFKHIIKVGSEIEFIQKLIEIKVLLDEKYDYWYFSKIDESVDLISIPYFDSEVGEFREFYPDFIFWLKKDAKRKIIFVDPKGINNLQNPFDKIDGFEEFKNQLKNEIEVELVLYNENPIVQGIEEKYKKYWKTDIEDIL